MTRTQTDDGEAGDLRDALAGDHDAFMRAVTPYRNELHRHCYRMTGSVDDADDILQETLFRAWRGLGTYAGRSSFRAWLYRIATNRSIDALGGRARQELPVAWEGQEDGLEPMWLQPYPDDPADVVERREHIATAFVVAIQALPPRQRAALLLKDVLGFSVPDIADALETTRAAVNSALQRARATVGHATETRSSTDDEAALRDQLMDAWQRADIDALTSLMTRDIVITMPPDPLRFDGPAAVVASLVSIAPDGRLDRMRLLASSANQQPSVGLYLPDDQGRMAANALITLGTRDDRISRMTAFRLSPGRLARHGLPVDLPID
ncbi:RNA polymerase subunit sigma-70 [Salsipaludibacter albus]|uniref:RNA polymerase subunit sigma-70 n=1 Tax=Salsipaludibacter albus TaxID=2849650 RepID=UPI001EE3AC88|nr:RNA polymerase subunit sigma-70 [Salsipaludibacter albus]MBY5162280.1 RNA polymerase subunit sigma-70 [Salsipaludibacter albus]